jgi:hypothetical protein
MKVILRKKYMSGFFGSLLFMLFLPCLIYGQGKDSTRTITPPPDTISVPHYFSFGFDVSRLFLSVTGTPFKGGEVSFDFRRKGILYDLHVGVVDHTKDLTVYTANSNGFYCGLGISKSLIDDESNLLSFGVRLVGSSYTYQPGNVKLPDFAEKSFDLFDLPATNNSAMWGEINGSVRTRITGWIMMGFEVRMKGILFNRKAGFTPYFIPGYGLAKNAFAPGVNYFIFVQIPKGKNRASKTH